jgi:hypothetical protein
MRFNSAFTGLIQLILMAAPFKAWVCGHWLAKIVGSNAAGGMEVRLL